MHGQRSLLKPQYRLLHDLVAKSILAKAGAFNAYTQQRFEIMAVMIRGIPVNWSHMLYNILLDMVTGSSRQSPGFAVQITCLLDSMAIPISSEFTAAKIINELTVGPFQPVEADAATPRRNRGEASSSQAGQTAPRRKRGRSTEPAEPVSVPPPVSRRRRRLSRPELVFEDVITVAPISTVPLFHDVEDEEVQDDEPLIRRPRGQPDPMVIHSTSTESSEVPTVQADETVPSVQTDSPQSVQAEESVPTIQVPTVQAQTVQEKAVQSDPLPVQTDEQNEQMEIDPPSVQIQTEADMQLVRAYSFTEDDFMQFLDDLYINPPETETATEPAPATAEIKEAEVEETVAVTEADNEEAVPTGPVADPDTPSMSHAPAPVPAINTGSLPTIFEEVEEDLSEAIIPETGAGSSLPWEVEEQEQKPVPIEKQTVDLINAEINEYVKEVTDAYDNWTLKRNQVRFCDFPARHYIEQENYILRLAATEDVATALRRRDLVADRCREAHLNNILKEREEVYKLDEDQELTDIRTNIALEEQLTLLRQKMEAEKKRTATTGSSAALRQPHPLPLVPIRQTREADAKSAKLKGKQKL